MKQFLRVLAASITLLVTLATAQADDLKGIPRIVDGDTIEISQQRIRLFGIDAPEGKQRCKLNGKPWRCGKQSTFALAQFIGKAWVRCNEKGRDRYKRIVAVCYLGNKDINAWMVSNGWAVDYPQYSKGAYKAEQLHAKQDKLGLWQGEFIAPWDWRRGKRLTKAKKKDTVRTGCRIKGNISRSGRIYHVPGGQHYKRTNITASKDERWFCSETEALAAGWRRSKG
jgi:endonuclease YncB( thermonuclease family)